MESLNINKKDKVGNNLIEEFIHNNNKKNNNETEIKNENLLIYVLTFNIQGSMPTDEELPLLFPKTENFDKFDIFVINTQECLRSITASFFVNSKEPWIFALKNFFGNKYINIINSNLGALHISIFVKKEKVLDFKDLRNGEIKTGFLNIMSNKGAVSASMKYLDKNILFICCHLASGQDNIKERNQNLLRIRSFLVNSVNKDYINKLKSIKKSFYNEQKALNNQESKEPNNKNNVFNYDNIKEKSINVRSLIFSTNNLNNNNNEQSEEKKIDIFDDIKEVEEIEITKVNNKENNKENNNKIDDKIQNDNKSFESKENDKNNEEKDKYINEYDIVIMSGDFNYRLNMNDDEITEIIEKNDPEILWDRDQLTKDIKKKQKLNEGIINFMPTYKFNHSNEYDYSRKPGWTDRILYKSKNFYDIMLCEYSSINNIYISDHKPVYAVFKVKCKNINYLNDKYVKNKEECIII